MNDILELPDGTELELPARSKSRSIWLVVRQWAGGRRDILAAHALESTARAAAAELVGSGDPLMSAITLQAVPFVGP